MAQGRVVLITGSNRGIGLAAAKLFLKDGYRVFLSDLNLKGAREELKEYGEDRIGYFEMDVTKDEQVKAMTQAALKQFGQVDGVVVNAGLSAAILPWLEAPVEDVDRMHSVNVKGAWLTAKHGVQAMLDSPSKGRGGSIVFVASVASTYGEPGMSGYTASKWAVRGLSLTAAQEFAPYGIRSNCIQPGPTDTAMLQVFPDDLRNAITSGHPMKRAADPREIAEVMVFLVSEKSSYMNGSTIAVHGGQTPT